MLIQTPHGSSKAGRDIVKRFREALTLKGDWQEPTWPLPNMREVSESDFWSWRSSNVFQAEAWQGETGNDDYPGTAMLFYSGFSQLIDGGFAVLVAYDYPVRPPVRYFDWRTCDHDFLSKATGGGQQLSTCKKCGRSFERDSSGQLDRPLPGTPRPNSEG